MKKKVLALLLAFCMVFGLSACGGGQTKSGGGSDETSGVSACAEGFLGAIDKGDYDTACTYCTDEVVEALGIGDVSSQIMEQFTSALGQTDMKLDKDAEAAMMDFATKILDAMVKEASASSDIKNSGSEYEVPGKITFFEAPDQTKINTMIQEQVNAITADTDKMAKYQEVYQSDGMEGMYNLMIADLMPVLGDEFVKVILEGKTQTEEVTLTISEVDGSYKITKTSDNLGNFSEGLTDSTN